MQRNTYQELFSQMKESQDFVNHPIAFQVSADQDAFLRNQAWEEHISIAELLRRMINKAMRAKRK